MSARYEMRLVGVFDTKVGELLTPMSGVAWEEYHAWLAAGGVPDPAPEPEAITLEEALANKLAEIEELAARQREKVTGAVSPQEMSSWTIKRDQALAFDAKAGDPSAPMLAIEARARGVATADIVARVRANAEAFSRAEATIAGVSGRHKDAVRALADADQVIAYDAGVGWPIPEPGRAPRDATPPP